jgi:periplasmic protein TonB
MKGLNALAWLIVISFCLIVFLVLSAIGLVILLVGYAIAIFAPIGGVVLIFVAIREIKGRKSENYSSSLDDSALMACLAGGVALITAGVGLNYKWTSAPFHFQFGNEPPAQMVDGSSDKSPSSESDLGAQSGWNEMPTDGKQPIISNLTADPPAAEARNLSGRNEAASVADSVPVDPVELSDVQSDMAKRRLRPMPPAPRSPVKSWISPDDYPMSLVRDEIGGVVGFKLKIGRSGTISGCEITRSSGHPELDDATCEALNKRARFSPATDETGNAVEGVFSDKVTWKIGD